MIPKKNTILAARVTTEDKNILKFLSEKLDCSTSRILRLALRAYLKRIQADDALPTI